LLGIHPNQQQMGEVGDSRAQTVYVCLDADVSGAGPAAAARVTGRLRAAGIDARQVVLPLGYDPNRFFVAGATAGDFQRRLDQARP
jgi:hypothetical protein